MAEGREPGGAEHARRHLAPPFRRLGPAPVPGPAARTWVDLGSGAGFPGLVIAILLAARRRPLSPRAESVSARGASGSGPLTLLSRKGEREPRQRAPRVTLIESNARKCAFLREVVRQTGIAAPAVSLWISCRQESKPRRLKLVCTRPTWFRRVHWRRSTSCSALRPRLFSPSTVGLILEGPRRRRGAESSRKDVEFQC